MTDGTDVAAALAEAVRGPGEPPVDLRETHMSWVLLTPDRAYKLKKPVRFDFLDLTDASARQAACEEEVRVNQALAADVVLGVRPVVRRGDGLALGDGEQDEADPVDWVVEMRRFDEGRTMAAAVGRGDLPVRDVVATAGRIAAFHAAADLPPVDGWAEMVAEAWRVNVDELGRAAGSLVAQERIEAALRFAAGFTRRRAATFNARADAGRIVDGHGDLRAEHVVLRDGDVTIVDRLEFDPRLRRVDVADDLAFLAMDLRGLGAGWAADALVDAYRAAGGDPGDAGLVAAFAAYRAQVRAKVGLLRAAQLPEAEREAAQRAALALVGLAERLAWTARGPVALAIAGPPASGKSTVAAAIAEAGGLPVLSSDLVRKELLGIPAGEPAPASAYTDEARRRVYAELGERAGQELARGSVVVDATFATTELRDAFLARLPPDADDALRVVVCDAPAEVRIERARARAAEGGGASDAGPDVAERLAAPSAELPVAPERRIVVTTTEPAARAADRVAAWLDDAP